MLQMIYHIQLKVNNKWYHIPFSHENEPFSIAEKQLTMYPYIYTVSIFFILNPSKRS